MTAPLRDSFTPVRYYTQFDPYFYSVDNRPISDLAANDLILANAIDNINVNVLNVLSASNGSALVGFIQSGIGAVARTSQDKQRETISPEDFGAIGDNTDHLLSERFASLAAAQTVYPFVTSLTQQIDWAAWQAAVNASSHQFDGLPKPAIYMGAGKKYKIGADPIVPPGYIIKIIGQGMLSSFINFTGPACFKSPAIQYFCPIFEDFSIEGDAASGYGIDLSPTISEVFLGRFDKISITSGSDCIYAPRLFSCEFSTVNGNSFNGHTFRVACGPSVSWRNCYAASCGTGKAGYRLTGTIRLYSCNGVNSADYWGVFGSNITGSSGTAAWQNDFSQTSYPDIELHGCNVEAYTKGGVWVVLPPQNLKFHGGDIDRQALSSAYEFDVRVSENPLGTGSPGCIFDQTRIFLGSGVPSLAHLYSDATAPFMEVNGDFWTGAGITTYRANGVSLNYPIIRQSILGDVFQGIGVRFNALLPRRISAELLRFKELTPASLTTAPDATGYTLIKTANAGPTSIDRVTYTATLGADLDAGRNGFLIIQVEDTNTTLVHGAVVNGGLRLRDRVSYVASKGDVFVFIQSSFDLDGGGRTLWMEIGRTSRAGRRLGTQGIPVASVNNLSVGTDGDYFQITGNTQINLLDNTGWSGGSPITLKFNSNPTIKHNQAASGNNKPIFLNASADFVAAASSTLTLRYDASDSIWYEQSRKA